MSTQQTSLAILSRCIPVFVAHEPRDLPYASLLDYLQFSLVLSQFDVLRPRGEYALITRLRRLVANGAYGIMRHNLKAASGFFNYTSKGPHSPYGAMLAQVVGADRLEELAGGKKARQPEMQLRRERSTLRTKLEEARVEGELVAYYQANPPSPPTPTKRVGWRKKNGHWKAIMRPIWEPMKFGMATPGKQPPPQKGQQENDKEVDHRTKRRL